MKNAQIFNEFFRSIVKLSGPRVNPTLIEKYTTMKFQASDSDGSGEIEIREFLGLFAAFLKERNIKLSDNFAAELQNEAEAPGTTERDLVDREAMLLAEKEEKERAETARIEKEAREKAEKEQADRERAEREKAAREQAEQERKARDKLEAERVERENQQREAARKKAESEKAEKEKAAQEKAERDRAARNKAEKERKELEKAEKERAEREKAEKERSAIKAAQQTKIEAESVERELPRVLFGDSQTFFDEKNQFFNKPLLISTIRQIVEESTFHLLKRIDFLEKQVAELKSTKKEERISAFTPKDIIHIHSENESSEEELEDDEERNGTAARPSANEKQAADFFGKILGGSKGGPQAEVLESIQLRTENLELKNKLLQLEVELMKSKESNALAVAAVPDSVAAVSKSQSVEKKVDSGIIGLNIGGKIFTASRKALLDSPAKKYFNLLFDNPVLDSFGNYFIDRFVPSPFPLYLSMLLLSPILSLFLPSIHSFFPFLPRYPFHSFLLPFSCFLFLPSCLFLHSIPCSFPFLPCYPLDSIYSSFPFPPFYFFFITPAIPCYPSYSFLPFTSLLALIPMERLNNDLYLFL